MNNLSNELLVTIFVQIDNITTIYSIAYVCRQWQLIYRKYRKLFVKKPVYNVTITELPSNTIELAFYKLAVGGERTTVSMIAKKMYKKLEYIQLNECLTIHQSLTSRIMIRLLKKSYRAKIDRLIVEMNIKIGEVKMQSITYAIIEEIFDIIKPTTTAFIGRPTLDSIHYMPTNVHGNGRIAVFNIDLFFKFLDTNRMHFGAAPVDDIRCEGRHFNFDSILEIVTEQSSIVGNNQCFICMSRCVLSIPYDYNWHQQETFKLIQLLYEMEDRRLGTYRFLRNTDIQLVILLCTDFCLLICLLRLLPYKWWYLSNSRLAECNIL